MVVITIDTRIAMKPPASVVRPRTCGYGFELFSVTEYLAPTLDRLESRLGPAAPVVTFGGLYHLISVDGRNPPHRNDPWIRR